MHCAAMLKRVKFLITYAKYSLFKFWWVFVLLRYIKYELMLREMVKNLPLLRRAGNSGRPWVHATICVTTHTATLCMIIHGNSCFNLVKSANRYWLHRTVRRTTSAYNRTIATKGLFIMCPSANIIRVKDKLILQINDSGIYFWI